MFVQFVHCQSRCLMRLFAHLQLLLNLLMYPEIYKKENKYKSEKKSVDKS